MKNSLLVLLVLALSCQKQVVKKDEVGLASHNARNSLDYVGSYKGILPCPDCHGLETEIVINENSTFNIKTKYQGKGEKIYLKKGNFTWNKKGTIIILTDVKNAPNKYFVGENTLTQLNIDGKRITGNTANEYVLSKQPYRASTIETTEQNSTTVDLNSRIEATTVIKKVNPAVGRYPLAETKWRLVSLKNKTVKQIGDKAYYLKLNSKDAKFTAFAGCNSIAGNYIMPSSNKLDFSDVI